MSSALSKLWYRSRLKSVACCRIVWSAASTTNQIRIAGSVNRRMNSGTMSLTARIVMTISVSVPRRAQGASRSGDACIEPRSFPPDRVVDAMRIVGHREFRIDSGISGGVARSVGR